MRPALHFSCSLRGQVLRHLECRISARRTFSNGYRLLERRTPKPTPNKPPIPQVRPPPAIPRRTNIRNDAPYAHRLLGDSDRVLLYASSKQYSLYASSYLVGFALIFGSYSWAQFALKEAPVEDDQPNSNARRPWYIKALLATEILLVAGLGTHFMLTPNNLIKSIALVRAAASSTPSPSNKLLLRLEIKRNLPFLKPDVIETSSDNVVFAWKVGTSSPFRGYSMPLERAKTFTSDYFSDKLEWPNPRKTMGQRLRLIWPAVRRETGRMFVRENMARVRSRDHGVFKMDLYGAVLLDSGRPLKNIIRGTEESSPGVLGWLKGLIWAK